MICNLEKMPMTPIGWPQLDHHQPEPEAASSASDSAMPATSSSKLMEKPPQDQQQQVLRCPRCDSANTKFCYYNNYSLSQPRHFCKACKRYWTRGGTLRNVPVGGGCRKNKRVKRHAPSASSEPPALTQSADISTTTTSASTSCSTNPGIYNLATGGAHPTSLPGFSLPAAGSRLPPVSLEGLNLPISSSSLDLHPMLSSLWLNFPNATTPSDHVDYNHQNSNHIHEPVNSPSIPPDYSFLGSSASSLLTSTLQQQKLMMGLRDTRPSNDFQVFFPMGDLHQAPISNGSSNFFKGMKMEQESLSMSIPCNSTIETMASDVNTYWNAGGVGASWPEATSYGPSVTPLI